MARGGKREGAGRPKLGPDGTNKHSVSLTPEMAEALEKLGYGNLSAGIRRAYERAMTTMDTYTYTEQQIDDLEDIGPTDMRGEAAECAKSGTEYHVYRITIYGADGYAKSQGATAMWVPSAGRLGIEYGAFTDWASVDDVGLEGGIEMWLNDNEEFANRN